MELTLGQLEDSRVGPDYYSKKNRVFKSSVQGRDYVVKIFRGEWRERASFEYSLLAQCHEKRLRTPVPVALIGPALVMEYIEGENVIDVFDSIFRDEPPRDASADFSVLSEALASWLFSFHSAFGFNLARNDTILRNFIHRKQEVYGLDLEEASRSDPIADLGQLCSNILGTTPMFTDDKFEFSRSIASRYWALSGNDRSDELGRAVAAALRHYASYRTQGGELLRWAGLFDSGEARI